VVVCVFYFSCLLNGTEQIRQNSEADNAFRHAEETELIRVSYELHIIGEIQFGIGQRYKCSLFTHI